MRKLAIRLGTGLLLLAATVSFTGCGYGAGIGAAVGAAAGAAIGGSIDGYDCYDCGDYYYATSEPEYVDTW